MRAALQFRAKLVPYLYTSARLAFDTGVALAHPMYYHWPQYREMFTYTTQYMLGRELLVCATSHCVAPA
jgi:alpha-glucosidase (family GH31 glycosyl hydrolase)